MALTNDAPDHPTDLAQLLSRIALGDRAAFDRLYRDTSPHLLGVILRIQRDRAQAEDVLQEVYVNVWRSAQSFNPALSQARTWLNSVARNRAIDSLRRRQSEPQTVSRFQAGPDEEDTDMLQDIAADTPDLPELIAELASRTDTGYLFGGLSAGQHHSQHLALDPHDTAGLSPDAAAGIWDGGLSGVAFGERVRLVSRVSQGCAPVGPRREITAADRNVIYELDGEPALTCLLRDLGVTATVSGSGWQREALPKVRATLAGLTDAASDLLSHGRHFGADTRVRHLIGLDPARQGVALADEVEVGMQMAFCQRHAQAARQDLVRICAEIREEFDPQDHPGSRAVGAVYISCAGRGGEHFGAPNAEMEILAHALGDIPVVGFFAGGEIARHHLYGYTGVLTVFGG